MSESASSPRRTISSRTSRNFRIGNTCGPMSAKYSSEWMIAGAGTERSEVKTRRLCEGRARRARGLELLVDRDRGARPLLARIGQERSVEHHQSTHPEREKNGVHGARPDHGRDLEGGGAQPGGPLDRGENGR